MVTYNSCYSKIIPDLQCPQEVGQKQECECNFSVLVGHPHCKTTTATKALSHGMRSATWIAQPYLTPTKTQSSKIPLFTTKCSYQLYIFKFSISQYLFMMQQNIIQGYTKQCPLQSSSWASNPINTHITICVFFMKKRKLEGKIRS